VLITFDCPKCESSLEIEASAAGSQIQCPQCNTPVTVPRKGVEPGTTIGGFQVAKLLGEGGMGQVFLARQLSTDRNVALKILPPEFTVREHFVERFRNEVRMAARLDHTNIVTVYEAGEDESIHYMAMAYVKGESLSEKLAREGAMPEKQALDMVRKLAGALAYAWDRHRVLHRDIKPSNIMIDQDGESPDMHRDARPSKERAHRQAPADAEAMADRQESPATSSRRGGFAARDSIRQDSGRQAGSAFAKAPADRSQIASLAVTSEDHPTSDAESHDSASREITVKRSSSRWSDRPVPVLQVEFPNPWRILANSPKNLKWSSLLQDIRTWFERQASS